MQIKFGIFVRVCVCICSGASVMSGITLTKLVGVGVLAGAKTRIFQIYYYRCV